MRLPGIGSHTLPREGRTNEWLTPPSIVQALGPFDLDPCAPVVRPWDTATKHYTIEDDGLRQPWVGRVWLNPPYGPHTGTWLRLLAKHGNGIALTFARTETRMFFDSVWSRARALLFLAGRPHFYYPDGTRARGSSGGPMVLIAYDDDNAARLQSSPIKGAYVTIR